MLRIPLFELAASQRWRETKLTSRRMIRSLRTLTMRPIVAASSPWFIAGLAKSMLWPSRRRPLESSWLLMYSDAVRRFSVSIMLGWKFKTQIEHEHSRHRERADGFLQSQLMVVWMAHIDGGAATLFGLVAMWGKVNKPAWDD